MIKFAVLWKLRSLAASCGTVSVKNPFQMQVLLVTLHVILNIM